MNSAELPCNVQDLQRDIVELLGQVSALMSRASTQLCFQEGTEDKYQKYRQRIEQERRKVENQELRMVIVAPMKAGKSTIVNAILGQPLLPSRAAAMTTVPTEMTFETGLSEPILTLSPQTLSVFQESFLALKREIDQQGQIPQVLKESSEYSLVEELLNRINSIPLFPVDAEISGYQRINETLSDLNDMIRLCSILELPSDPLNSLTDFPRIRTPFWRSPQSRQPDLLGKLVIVDTPGPNEAGIGRRLQTLVSQQLDNSSLVLIVLDFTQLKNEAAEDIKEQVQKTIRLRGKENLYVLVNKIDQRGDDDLNSEQLRQFVANNLKLVASNTERVFEVSAKRAFCSANFLYKVQQHPDVPIAEIKEAITFLQEAFGPLGWENALNFLTKEQLHDSAVKFWQQSGFASFLDKAINSLMEQALPLSMKSALQVALTCFLVLCEDVNIRKIAIGAEEKRVEDSIKFLEDEIYEVQQCYAELETEIGEQKNKLRQKINLILEQAKKDAKHALSLKLKNFTKSLIHPFKSALNINKESDLGVDEQSDLGIDEQSEEQHNFEFNQEKDAKEFANKLLNQMRSNADSILSGVCEQIEELIQNSIVDLSNLIVERIEPIVSGAREQLKEDLYVTLNLEPIQLDKVGIVLEDPEITRKSTKFTEEISDFIIRIIPNLFRYIIDAEIEERKNQYIISLNSYFDRVIQSIEEQVYLIKMQVNQYIDIKYEQRVNRYFMVLNEYLGNYKDNLQQSLRDKTLSIEEQKKLKQALESFTVGHDRSEIDNLIQEINSRIKRIEQLLTKK